MACRWRIRHKLMVGLGLVVSILALLLAGTLKGLLSYKNTMRSIEFKMAEIAKAGEFKRCVEDLQNPDPTGDLSEEWRHLQDKITSAKKALKEYREQLEFTVAHQHDTEDGHWELGEVDALNGYFDDLQNALQRARRFPRAAAEATRSLRDENQVREALQALLREAELLRAAIYDRVYRRLTDAKAENRTSLTIVIATEVVGVLLMLGMLRFFYRWVFYPVRDLQLGAERVAQGDFEHRIEVHSGDEMEDLADAFNDMTGRLQEIYRDLAHQVNERSRQLVRSERLASVGFLAAGVAHEINNPLASIAFCSEALESRLAEALARTPEDSDTVIRYLKMIQQEAFRCKTITQRLLEFSRTGELRREPTDLAELVQGVLDMVEHLQNRKGKRIAFESRGRTVAWVNAQEIKSVVLNLIVNALDSMDDGGTLTIALRQRERRAEMIFTDTGCGMAPQTLENIFEPFFTQSRTGKGTGLGLSISHRIITQHGGEIEAVSSGLQKGSTFTVRLPLQPAEPAKEEALGHAA